MIILFKSLKFLIITIIYISFFITILKIPNKYIKSSLGIEHLLNILFRILFVLPILILIISIWVPVLRIYGWASLSATIIFFILAIMGAMKIGV